MKSRLVKALIEKGAVRQGTSCQAFYNSRGLSGQYDSAILQTFLINTAKISADDAEISFDAFIDGERGRHRISCDDIVTLDGMDPSRICEIYNLTLDGEVVPRGKRRGRKPKNRSFDGVGLETAFSVFDFDEDDEDDDFLDDDADGGEDWDD